MEILLQARTSGSRLEDFPASCRPRDAAEAYAIQAAVAPHLGPIGGWKVGAPAPDAQPLCSPLPMRSILLAPAVAPQPLRYRGVEAEIAFRLGSDLPPRDIPYSREEILDAIGSCHGAIEVVETRFAEMDGAAHFSALADLQNHHALILGAPNPDWRRIDFKALKIMLEIGGWRCREAVGSNPAGDIFRLLAWLANEGSLWAGGLKAGNVVTTGSWIGKIPAAPGSSLVVAFEGFPAVEASLD